MSTTLPYRYPGAQPFTSTQEHLFFGREQAKRELYRLVQFEPLVVLYSRSGMGKSSLLNAGIIPTALRDDKFEPITVRFGAYTEGKQELPQGITRQALHQNEPTDSFLSKIFPDDLSLWYTAKVRILNARSPRQPLLIFDQFEELFTYPPEALEAFAKELGELLNTELPQRIRRMEQLFLQAQPDLLSEAERALLHQPMQVRVLLAIRSDRMSLLDKLTPFVPEILGKRYELKSLKDAEARDAILCPAQDLDRTYQSPTFEYETEAVNAIIEHLKKDVKQEIESFQLQIICHSLEEKVIDKKQLKISQADIGDLEKVFKAHYRTQINRIGTAEEQLIARRLIEEDLIFAEEERRLSLYEGQILRKTGMTEALLRQLENTHLIRREPSMQGGYSYELSHDTLVKPALEARAERHAEELREAEKAEHQRRMAEVVQLKSQAEEERRKREEQEQLRKLADENAARARRTARIAIALTIFALMVSGLAFWQYFVADSAKKEAETAQQEALMQKTEAEKNLKQFTDQKIKELLQNAETYQRSGDYPLAKKALEEALTYDSTRTDVKQLLEELNR